MAVSIRVILIGLLLSMVACGSKDKSSDDTTVNYRQECDASATFAGGWIDGSLNELDLGTDCYGQSTDACDLRFGYYKPVNGKMMIQVNSTNGGAGCPAMGENLCTFVHDTNDPSNEFLLVDCGQGQFIYTPK